MASPSPAPFRALEAALNARHLERAAVVHTLVLALLTRQHVFLLGPVGADKSRLARDCAAQIADARYFEILFHPTTREFEVLGQYSLHALEQDRLERLTAGMLPTAHVAFLDEFFRAKSSARNPMLAILNERLYHEAGGAQPVPLECAIGAANSLPDTEDYAADWDRFCFRHVVDYLANPQAFLQLLTLPPDPLPAPPLTLDALHAAQAAVQQVDPGAGPATLLACRDALRREGLVVSDRRWIWALRAAQAEAWLQGRAAVTAADCSVLQWIAWTDPTHRDTVARVVLALTDPLAGQIQALQLELQQALDAYQQAQDRGNGITAALQAIARLREQTEQLVARAQAAGQDPQRAVAFQATLRAQADALKHAYLEQIDVGGRL